MSGQETGDNCVLTESITTCDVDTIGCNMRRYDTSPTITVAEFRGLASVKDPSIYIFDRQMLFWTGRHWTRLVMSDGNFGCQNLDISIIIIIHTMHIWPGMCNVHAHTHTGGYTYTCTCTLTIFMLRCGFSYGSNKLYGTITNLSNNLAA